jgi:hypothetical protein
MKKSLAVHHIVLYPDPVYDYIREMEVYISDTPIIPNIPQPSWGAPVAKLQSSGRGTGIIVEFPSGTSCQYIAMVFLSSSAWSYINLMELEVFRY